MFYYENTLQEPKRVLAGEETFNITFPTIGPTNISSSYLSTIYSTSELGYYVRTSIFSATTTKDPDKLLKIKKKLNYINGNGNTIENYEDIIIENLLTTSVTRYRFLNRSSFFDTGVYEGIYGTIYESLDKKTVTVEIFFYMNSTDRSKLATIPSTPSKSSEYEHYRGRQYDYLSIGNSYDIVNIVKYENDTVYGRPFSLSVTNSGTTTLITRTSSPNEHATQTTLLDGDTVYYGDVLSITVAVKSGYSSATADFSNNSSTKLTSAGTRKYTVTVTDNISLSFSARKQYTLTIKQLPAACTISLKYGGTSSTTLSGSTSAAKTYTITEGYGIQISSLSCTRNAYTVTYTVNFGSGAVNTGRTDKYLDTSYTTVKEDLTITVVRSSKLTQTVWTGSVSSDWFRNGYARASFTPNKTLTKSTITNDSSSFQSIRFNGKVTFGSKANQSASHSFSLSGDWSGTLTHASWTGNINSHAYPTYIEFDGNNMGAYYGKGTVTGVYYVDPTTSSYSY